MAITNFPQGFKDGITLRGVPVIQTHPGKVFWVSNATTLQPGQRGGSDGNKGTFESPFGTLDYAIGQCTASRGDIILIKPGHAETISTATAVAADVAGVAIIGLGSGSLRPTFTFDTATTATIGVTAANIAFKNIIFTANFADIVSVFTLTTAKYFTVEDCYIKATAANMNFLWVVDTDATTANADGLALINNKWIEPDLATKSMVKLDGTNADVQMFGNYVNLGVLNNNAALMTIANGKIVTSLDMRRNIVYRLNTDTATGAILLHTDGSTLTGIVADNFAQHADTAAELLITASAGLGTFNNYASGVAGASGYLLPAADS
jgi:hypothetical protein